MKLQFITVCLCVLASSSCHWDAPKKQEPVKAKVKVKFKDTLSYTDKIIKRRASDCWNKADTSCTVVDIEYPFFVGQQKLNDSIKNKLLNLLLFGDDGVSSLQQLSVSFLKMYDKYKAKNDRDLFYTLDLSANVLNQDSAITTLAITGYQFSGGIHGGAQSAFINWNTKENKAITLSDILVDGYKGKLTKIAERVFRKQEKLADMATLADSYFFKNDKFALNNNFCVTPKGINFLYNEYEIKPYSEGATELIVPYSQIKSLLKPNTIIRQYIK